MNLTSAGVSSGAVGKVIKEVSKLVGKSVDHVPSRQTVDRISVQKVAVVQKQVIWHCIQIKHQNLESPMVCLLSQIPQRTPTY